LINIKDEIIATIYEAEESQIRIKEKEKEVDNLLNDINEFNNNELMYEGNNNNENVIEKLNDLKEKLQNYGKNSFKNNNNNM